MSLIFPTLYFALMSSLSLATPLEKASALGNSISPWYFHTGQGYYEASFTDQNGEAVTERYSCDLDPLDKDCKELVYHFSKTELSEFVDMARELYEERINSSESNIGIAVLIASWASRTAYNAFLIPEPTVSKITGLLAGLVTTASAAYTAWEGLHLSELYQIVDEINQTLSSEGLYVARCGHVRANFYQRLDELGVKLIFSRQGGTLISSDKYFEAQKNHARQLEEVARWEREGMSTEEAQRTYHMSCRQMPLLSFESLDAERDESASEFDWTAQP